MNPESEPPIRLTVLGCGDAFGSGGRLQTCFHVRAPGLSFLIDCGATAAIGLRRSGLDTRDVEAVFLTHYHADHFAGLPFLLIEARISGRTAPLTVAGPPGLRDRLEAATHSLFPGSRLELPFELRLIEYDAARPASVGPAEVSALPVIHAPETRPHALRIEVAGRVIAFSGDTEWTPALLDVARGADLFLCECSSLHAPVPTHLDHATLQVHRSALECRRLVLTHMGADVLANGPAVSATLQATLAEDGLELSIP
jgi:ribonuclease BN (tRNA processing enzyme)